MLLVQGATIAGTIAPSRAFADVATPAIPPEFQNVGVDEHPNFQIPLDLKFLDDHDNIVPLSTFFDGKRPVVLQMGYYSCPKLCDVISQTFVQSARQLDLRAGKDFQFVFVSIDPAEVAEMAAEKKQSLVEAYLRPGAEDGFHCLVGQESNIRELAKAVGFRYKQVIQAGQASYSHPSVLFVMTPDGHISRYLYGVAVPPQTLELSLVEASQGKVGTSYDKLALMICCYDVETGKYTLAAMGLMRVGAIGTMLALGGFGFWLFRHGGSRRAGGTT